MTCYRFCVVWHAELSENDLEISRAHSRSRLKTLYTVKKLQLPAYGSALPKSTDLNIAAGYDLDFEVRIFISAVDDGQFISLHTWYLLFKLSFRNLSLELNLVSPEMNSNLTRVNTAHVILIILFCLIMGPATWVAIRQTFMIHYVLWFDQDTWVTIISATLRVTYFRTKNCFSGRRILKMSVFIHLSK